MLVVIPDAKVANRPNKASFHRVIVYLKNFLYTGHENFLFYFYLLYLELRLFRFDLPLFSALNIEEYEDRPVESLSLDNNDYFNT